LTASYHAPPPAVSHGHVPDGMSGESFEAAGTDRPGNPPVGKVRRRWARDGDGSVVPAAGGAGRLPEARRRDSTPG